MCPRLVRSCGTGFLKHCTYFGGRAVQQTLCALIFANFRPVDAAAALTEARRRGSRLVRQTGGSMQAIVVSLHSLGP